MNRKRAMDVLGRLDPAAGDAEGGSRGARELMESIVRSEEGPRAPGPPRRVSPRLVTGLAVALLLVPAGIGLWLAFGGTLSDPDPRRSAGQAPPASEEPSGPPTPQASTQPVGEPRYEATATVLQWQDQPARLCLGVILESLPPQCGDIPIPNWDWDTVDGEENMSGVRWGEFHVVGTYDGQSFTLIEAGPAKSRPDDPSDDIESPCPVPDGGWTATDPSRVSDPDLRAANREAGSQPDVSGVWITYLQEPVTEETAIPSNILLNVAFTGDIEEHRAALAEIWGGPMCVVQFERSESELRRIQNELTNRGPEEFGFVLLSASTDIFHNQVEIGVVVADEELQQAIDERYGEGVVQLDPALRPVDENRPLDHS